MASSQPQNDLLTSLNRDGFVRIPSVLTTDELSTLRTATARITDLARSGKWPYLRTLPKQFPPWPSSPADGIWGVQHLLHPNQPDQATFLRSYFSDKTIEPVKQLLECGEDELVMELYNLLVRPDKDFALRWHRDDIGPDATAEEETERLNEPSWHAQWNLALYDDRSLIVVPGSHKRARTEEERAAHPFEDEMPGQMVVEMKAGDVIFYNNNILHRGVYDASVERMTLHGSIGHSGGSKARARNVLQHGVGEWVGQIDFSSLDEETRKRAEGMRQRLVEMGSSAGNVGFFSEKE